MKLVGRELVRREDEALKKELSNSGRAAQLKKVGILARLESTDYFEKDGSPNLQKLFDK